MNIMIVPVMFKAVMQKIGGIWKVINYDGGEAA